MSMRIHHLVSVAAVAGALALPASAAAKPVYPPPVCGDTAVECAIYVVDKYTGGLGCGGPVCPAVPVARI
jgi:hypothetical protein